MDAAGPRASLRAPCSGGLCRGPTGGSHTEQGDRRALSVDRSPGPLRRHATSSQPPSQGGIISPTSRKGKPRLREAEQPSQGLKAKGSPSRTWSPGLCGSGCARPPALRSGDGPQTTWRGGSHGAPLLCLVPLTLLPPNLISSPLLMALRKQEAGSSRLVFSNIIVTKLRGHPLSQGSSVSPSV